MNIAISSTDHHVSEPWHFQIQTKFSAEFTPMQNYSTLIEWQHHGLVFISFANSLTLLHAPITEIVNTFEIY